MEKIRFVGGPWDGRIMEVAPGLPFFNVPLDKPSTTIPENGGIPMPIIESVEYVRRRLAKTGEEVFVFDDQDQGR